MCECSEVDSGLPGPVVPAAADRRASEPARRRTAGALLHTEEAAAHLAGALEARQHRQALPWNRTHDALMRR